MLRVSAVSPPRARAGSGDHERALRQLLSGAQPDNGLKARIEAENRLIPHNFLGVVDRRLECDHPGCQALFTVRLVPGQLVYPRWCDQHRTPHRRSLPG
jgi:hypothetical protein